jgi:hypothetical protein
MCIIQGVMMTKKILNKDVLKRVIKTTQRIEGYSESSKEILMETKTIREKYGIKVSIKR